MAFIELGFIFQNFYLLPRLTAAQTIGKNVTFGGVAYTVVGATSASPSTSLFGGSNFLSAFFLLYATIKQQMTNMQIFRIVVKAKDSSDVKKVAAGLRETLLRQHKGSDDFTVFTQDDIVHVVDNILSIMTAAIAGIGSLSLLVGGIGSMNIMLVSVTERTKEIGLRKAIGASNSNILFQFLTEAVMLSMIGGGIGVVGAAVASRIIHDQASLSVIVDARSAGLAFVFSLFVGTFFGVAPAIRASRLHSIQALRYE